MELSPPAQGLLSLELSQLSESLAQQRRRLDRTTAERELLIRQRKQLELQHNEKSVELDKLAQVIRLMESLADAGQKEMIGLITKIATVGMTEVFGSPILLVAEVREKRGTQGLELKLVIDGNLRDLDQVGGGLIDVLSFILQVAVVKLMGAAPVLLLDEPFKHLSKNYLPRISQLVNSLASLMGMQIVIVTHENQLVTGDFVYRLELKDGATVVVDESDD